MNDWLRSFNNVGALGEIKSPSETKTKFGGVTNAWFWQHLCKHCFVEEVNYLSVQYTELVKLVSSLQICTTVKKKEEKTQGSAQTKTVKLGTLFV